MCDAGSYIGKHLCSALLRLRGGSNAPVDNEVPTELQLLSLPDELQLMIIRRLDAHDVIVLSSCCDALSIGVIQSSFLHEAASQIAWAQRMVRSYVYYNASDRSLRAVSDLISVREVTRMSRRKHEQGLRRAVRRAGINNWLVPPTMRACAALRIGKLREQQPDRSLDMLLGNALNAGLMM